MATSTASTPRPVHHSHSRRPSAVTETPTPASSNASFSALMTSLKPSRSHNINLSSKRIHPPSSAGLRQASLNTLDSRPRPHSATRDLKSHPWPNSTAELDSLVDPIAPDDTELDRKEQEASFQRVMDDLAHARLSSTSPSSGSSVSSARRRMEQEHDQRRQFEDERSASGGTRSSDFTSGGDEDDSGSIRIGLSGTRYARGGAREVPLDPHEMDEDTDDNLTYITLPRTEDELEPSPAKKASPFAQHAPAYTRNSPLHSTVAPAMFSGTSPAGSPRRVTRYADENVPLHTTASSPQPPSFPRRVSPFVSSFSPRPSTFTATTTVNPPLRTAAVPLTTAFPSAASKPDAAGYRSSPLNPSQNSPVLAPRSSTQTLSSVAASHAYGKGGVPEYDYDAEPEKENASANETTTYRLPDMTYLTAALKSPAQSKTAARRMAAAPITGESARSGSPSTAKSGGSKDAPITSALSSLTAKLQTLERANAASSARVAELEARLASAEPQRSHAREREERAHVRQEVDALLRDERQRREEVESLVASLRAQNAHLDATLSAQSAALSTLRRAQEQQAAAAAALAVPGACSAAQELGVEVQDLKHGLSALGFEVEGVRTVVEGLLREKEEREGVRGWEREEAERRRTLGGDKEGASKVNRPVQAEVQKEAARAFSPPGTPASSSRASFISAADIELLKAEQEVERRRRTPKPETKAKTAKHLPPRPSSVPLPSRSHAAPPAPRSSTSLDDAPISPSHDELESSYYSSAPSSAQPRHAYRTHARAEDEPDFARAERIFDEVSVATSPRRHPRGERVRSKDRVQLEGEPSMNLCSNCHGRKRALVDGEKEAAGKGERKRRDVEKDKARKEKEQREEEREKRRVEEKEREEHRQTLESVLQRLEDDFEMQKKIYLELTAEYQAMGSKAATTKRRALAAHLKTSIDVLEDKAKDVKQYADALANLCDAAPRPSIRPAGERKRHAVV
ncbi:hypothetical protein JCM1840_000998 [Sporobolomyces johnsonii]